MERPFFVVVLAIRATSVECGRREAGRPGLYLGLTRASTVALCIPVPEFVRAWRVIGPGASGASRGFFLAGNFPNSSQAFRTGAAAEMSAARIAAGRFAVRF